MVTFPETVEKIFTKSVSGDLQALCLNISIPDNYIERILIEPQGHSTAVKLTWYGQMSREAFQILSTLNRSSKWRETMRQLREEVDARYRERKPTAGWMKASSLIRGRMHEDRHLEGEIRFLGRPYLPLEVDRVWLGEPAAHRLPIIGSSR